MNIKNMAGVALAAVSLALPTLAPGSLFAESQTRSDIEDMTVPSGWDASARTTYQVETAEETFEWFDSRFKSVEEFFFDLDSFPLGFLLFFR